MREVTKGEFFARINPLDVHPSIQPSPGTYPYTSLWKLRDGRAVVGKTSGRPDGSVAYFLPCPERPR